MACYDEVPRNPKLHMLKDGPTAYGWYDYNGGAPPIKRSDWLEMWAEWIDFIKKDKETLLNAQKGKRFDKEERDVIKIIENIHETTEWTEEMLHAFELGLDNPSIDNIENSWRRHQMRRCEDLREGDIVYFEPSDPNEYRPEYNLGPVYLDPNGVDWVFSGDDGRPGPPPKDYTPPRKLNYEDVNNSEVLVDVEGWPGSFKEYYIDEEWHFNPM